jgi:hypothetical protein
MAFTVVFSHLGVGLLNAYLVINSTFPLCISGTSTLTVVSSDMAIFYKLPTIAARKSKRVRPMSVTHALLYECVSCVRCEFLTSSLTMIDYFD